MQGLAQRTRFWANVGVALAALTITNPLHALTFGTFDVRTLAMGGAAVAAAEADSAVFYNPSLLALYDEIEEKHEYARVQFPLIVGEFSTSLTDLGNFERDDPEVSLTRAIVGFNANQNEANAQGVVNAAANLRGAFGSLQNEDLIGDGYFGLAISEPSKRQGAGFFAGVRAAGDGRTNITATDLTLLDAYVEGLTFIATNGAAGTPRPDLFTPAGNLRDPNPSFNSTLTARGLIIVEAGLALAREFHPFDRPIAFAITPKLMEISVFDTAQILTGQDISLNKNPGSHFLANFDLGAAVELGSNTRVGIAVKDVISRRFTSRAGNSIRLHSRSRVGVARQFGDTLLLAFDVDLSSNPSFGAGSATREVALGAEWAMRPRIRLRGGIRSDVGGDRGTIFSTGARFSWRRTDIDFVLARGNKLEAGGFQLGFAF